MTLFELTQAAEDGVPEAQFVLGFLYQNGLGYKRDRANAEKWYLRAVKQGVLAAEYSLGTLYGASSSGEFEKVFADYRSAIKTGKWPGDPVRAFKLYLRAARRGFWPAQDAVAGAFELGYGTKANPRKAFQWAKQSADSGYVRAASRLANMFEEGRGATVNLKYALHYYKRAAGLGDGLAAYMVASIYKKQKPMARYHKDILKWLHKAAERNHINAHWELYEVHSKGLYGQPISQKAAEKHQTCAEELTEAMTSDNLSPLHRT